MVHTHYNEIAYDGHAIYTATRSTGLIEEGPVGFSVTNLDHGVVSCRRYSKHPIRQEAQTRCN
jgi:3',5'-cyclic-AMP phosphodiesterase